MTVMKLNEWDLKDTTGFSPEFSPLECPAPNLNHPEMPNTSFQRPGIPSGNSHTHVGVVVIDFHQDVGRGLGHIPGIPENLDLVEDQGLIPGGVQGVLLHHRFLALVQEGHDGVGICGNGIWEWQSGMDLPRIPSSIQNQFSVDFGNSQLAPSHPEVSFRFCLRRKELPNPSRLESAFQPQTARFSRQFPRWKG